MDVKDLKPGMKLVFIDDRLNSGGPGDVPRALETAADKLNGQEVMVVAVTEVPGKQVAVATKKPSGGHTCDGLVPPGGYGWWVMADHLYTQEEHKQHAASSMEWAELKQESASLLDGFIEPG